MESEVNVSIPRRGQRSGELRVQGGMRSFRLAAWQNHPDAADDLLVDARFDGVVPRVSEAEGVLTVKYSRFGDFWRRQSAHVLLNEALPWTVDVSGGAQQLRADLRPLNLRAFRVGGGLQDVVLELGDPKGVVPIEIGGGVANLTITRPQGSALAARVHGGAQGLTLDQTSLGSVGGGIAWQSHEAALDRYELHIHGGAVQLVIGTSSALCKSSEPSQTSALIACF